jgi:surface polysaccharide O-acyltransferase-like enzyme
VFEAVTWLNAGYSLPSFMCLYLLARYMHIHRPAFTQFSRRTDLCICLGIVVAVTAVVFVARWKFGLGGVLYFYNSPTTILSATYLLLFFSRLSLRSRLVNWIAASALAVYLTHSNNWLGLYYDSTIQHWFATLPRFPFILSTALLILAVYAVSILLDKLRIWLYQRIFHQSK